MVTFPDKFSVAGFEFIKYSPSEFRYNYGERDFIAVFIPTDWKRWCAMHSSGRYLRKAGRSQLKAFGTYDTAAFAALKEWLPR